MFGSGRSEGRVSLNGETGATVTMAEWDWRRMMSFIVLKAGEMSSYLHVMMTNLVPL